MVIHFWLVQIVIQTNRVLRKLNSESEKEKKHTNFVKKWKKTQVTKLYRWIRNLLNDKLIKIDMDAVR